jgi:PKD repeat protein
MYDPGDLGGSNPPGPNDASTNGNIWVNTNEVPGNGVDDDGNGYTDDIIGWDFVERTDWYSYPCIDIDCGGADNDPSDGEGHGTHTAGTIAAITNNGYAVAGVAGGFGDGTFAGGGNGVKIVPCRIGYVLDYFIYGATGVVIMDYVAEAMYYMADLKTDGWNVAAINCSFGNSNTGGLGAAASYLIAQDVVICVAAGNSNANSPSYLSSRGDCIDIGATDVNGNPASFSNYGSWVDVAAPGVSVMSTITDPTDPGVDYVAVLDGTSMSCPHVAGVVGLLESFNPALSATDKIDIITDVANTKAYNMTKYVGVGIVDAKKCIDAAGGGCDLVADFTGSPTSGCVPLTVSFTDQSTGTGIDGWSWTFGDGGSSTSQNPTYEYTSAGTYTVSLTVSSTSQGCNDQVTKTGYITVNPLPVADFSGSPTSGTEPLTVDFTDLSSDATSWDWDFGDTGSSTAQNPSHTYSAGTYTVTLTASNACGSDVATKVDYITVAPCVAPTAGFSGTPTSGDAPLTVDFSDLSTGSPTSWDWDFGDASGTSTQQNPSYTYTNPGTYTVTLTATNACGSDAETRTDYITVTCTAPVADFSGTPTTGCAPLAVDFTDLSTNATSWSWDFGDGAGSSTAQNPSYSYTDPGCYTVTLTATNACGSDVATKVDYVCVDACGPDHAYANADIPVVGTVSGDFTNTLASDDVYEGITEVEYTNHPRKRSSYLEHKWTVEVGGGGSSMMFYVEGYRPANADGDDFTFAYSTDNVNFTDMVTIAGSTDQVYSYALPAGLTGTIYVRVVDTDLSWGNTSLDAVYVDEMYIEFSSQPGPPAADFAASPTSGDEPLAVDFMDLSTGSPTSWSWDFGDGVGTSTAQNPSYTYNNAGTYTVELTASNAYGSSTETKIDYITVTVPGADYSHVDNMVVGTTRSGPNTLGTCTVTIFDDNDLPLSNATVFVTYDGPTSGSDNGVTGSDGTVYFETTGFKKPTGEWCFEVTDITHATHTYDPASNNVTYACESGWVYSDSRGSATRLQPAEFTLDQNRPNPFNPTTEISLYLPSDGYVRLNVYNILGANVATLIDGWTSAGEHTVIWNAADQSSGLYFYMLTTDKASLTKKMILLK